MIAYYELVLLALMMWREARNQPPSIRLQVGWTVLNRVMNPKWWGNDVVSVITKKWQYSSINAPGDKQMGLWPAVDDGVFIECLQQAGVLLHDDTISRVILYPHADSYYDDSIPPPKWATPDKRNGTLGPFAFYNIDGDTGD